MLITDSITYITPDGFLTQNMVVQLQIVFYLQMEVMHNPDGNHIPGGKLNARWNSY
jgi:hypothetical protein